MLKPLITKVLLPVLSLSILAVACTPSETPTADTPDPAATETAPAEMGEMATTVVLPDGTECLHAGEGATLAFEDKRLNYTCGDTQGLLGDIEITSGMEVTLDVATIDGTTITESEPLTLAINAVELADGTVCLNAGEGATLAFDDQRLNFTCPEAAEETGLLGDIATDGAAFSVERATLDGTSLVSRESTAIATIETAEP